MLGPEALFRKEVQQHHRNRVYGEVIVSPSISGWIWLSLVTCVLLSAITWASFVQFPRTESSPGIITTAQPVIKIVAQRSGVVSAVFVHDGQSVKPGEPLVSVGTQPALVAGKDQQIALASQMALKLREADVAARDALLERRRLGLTIEGLNAQREGLNQQTLEQQRLVASAKSASDQLDQVLARGFITRLDYERRRQEAIRSEQQLAALRNELASNLTSIKMARTELSRLPLKIKQKQLELSGLKQAIASSQATLSADSRYTITSVAFARVTAIQTAVGRVADGHTPLLVLVPEGAILQAEVMAPSRAIGFVRLGQPVRLRLDAFPFQQYGNVEGFVESESQIVLLPNEADSAIHLSEPAYRVIVHLNRQTINISGRPIPLQPGMTAQAIIVLDRRSLLSAFIAPILAHLN